jgi:hypothetical protein
MAGRVRWLVEIDYTGTDIGFEITLERRASGGNWCEMTSSNKNCKSQMN